MNSTLKQSQSPGVGGKPMQNAATYGQPSTHISQNPYPNINVAHAHSTMQQNHFPQHYSNIQPSNHPVANQGGGNNKNLAAYYQHAQNVTTANENVDKPHSNGTSEGNKAQESVKVDEKQENRVENSKTAEEKQETSTSVNVEAPQQSRKEEVEEIVKEVQEKEPELMSVGNSNNSNNSSVEAAPQQKVDDVAKDEGENLKERKVDEEVEEEEEEEEEDEVVCKESEEEECDDKNKSSEESNDGDKAEIPSKKPKQRPQQRKPPVQKSPSGGGGAPKAKRQRTKTQHYQSPLPEMEIITKITSTTPKSRNNDERLIYFYRNEFLAVRNAEGGFYLCQTLQNVYRTSSKIKIRWLSQDKSDKTGEIYTPDFYDQTDFDCILTSLDLMRVDKGMYRLTEEEKERTDSILKRCLAVEKGEIVSPSLSEEHPDGLDISLYKDEEQLKKKQTTKRQGRKRKARSTSTKKSQQQQQPTPTKKSPETPKARKVEESQTTNAKTRRTPVKSKKPSAAVTAVKKAAQEVNKRAAAAVNSNVAGVSKRGKGKKVSPVVDEKKAKVLAKIGRKASVVAAAAKVQSKGGKSPKAASKAASTRKTKRSHKN